jgi:hypothetical protein
MMAARQSLELANHAPDLDSGKEPGVEKKRLDWAEHGNVLGQLVC